MAALLVDETDDYAGCIDLIVKFVERTDFRRPESSMGAARLSEEIVAGFRMDEEG